jgi:hypothetical protein
MAVADIFRLCVEAIQQEELIIRPNRDDKEFHFQNWFKQQLQKTGLHFEAPGRNVYPDVCMVESIEGYELKGLGYPGRHVNFDSNSQMPTGRHNGRTIYYVFGRYPKKPDGDSFPVLDLVICHGDFLNADHDYVHRNENVKGFGSYGDIMIRDRKMYVVPTPFRLLNGVAHHQTLILPDYEQPGGTFKEVGTVCRREADEVVVAYAFDLQKNELRSTKVTNPHAGKEHRFLAWRLSNSPDAPVEMRASDSSSQNQESVDDEV